MAQFVEILPHGNEGPTQLQSRKIAKKILIIDTMTIDYLAMIGVHLPAPQRTVGH